MTHKPLFSELDTKVIEQGLAHPLIAEFFECARSNDFQLNHRTREWFPHLTLCSTVMEDNQAPPIIYIGTKSDQRKLFSNSWRAQLGDTLRTPDPELERNSALGYRKAIEGAPYYGYARSPVTIGGERHDVAFERLILTLSPAGDPQSRICAYMGIIHETNPIRMM